MEPRNVSIQFDCFHDGDGELVVAWLAPNVHPNYFSPDRYVVNIMSYNVSASNREACQLDTFSVNATSLWQEFRRECRAHVVYMAEVQSVFTAANLRSRFTRATNASKTQSGVYRLIFVNIFLCFQIFQRLLYATGSFQSMVLLFSSFSTSPG